MQTFACNVYDWCVVLLALFTRDMCPYVWIVQMRFEQVEGKSPSSLALLVSYTGVRKKGVNNWSEESEKQIIWFSIQVGWYDHTTCTLNMWMPFIHAIRNIYIFTSIYIFWILRSVAVRKLCELEKSRVHSIYAAFSMCKHTI